MVPKFRLVMASALVVGMLTAACGGGAASPTAAPTKAAAAPITAPAATSPTTAAVAPTTAPAASAPTAAAAAPTAAGSGTTGDAAAGQAVFAQNCDACHPGGDRGTGPALKGRNIPADQIARQVRNGGSGMPAFSTSQISDQQLANLVAYVQSLK